jgi:flagellar hook-associated protein 3 FlgL
VKTDGSGNTVTPDTATVHRLRIGYSDVKSAGFSMTYHNTDVSVSADGKTADVTTYQLDGSGAIVKDASGNKVVAATTTVNADANGKFTFNDSTGSSVTLGTTVNSNYSPTANEIVFNSSTGEVLLGDTAYKNVYSDNSFSFTYEKDNFVKNDLNPIMYFNCVDKNTGIKYTKKAEDIEYNVNFAQKLKINTEACDAFNINLGRDVDELKTSVQNAIDVDAQITKVKSMMTEAQYSDSTSQAKLGSILEGLTKQSELAKTQMTNAFESGLAQMKNYQQQVSAAKSDVGNRETRLSLTKSRLTEQKTNFTSLKSANEDIDLEDVVVSYSAAEQVYNASLSAASKVVKQSLLDFL